MPNWCTSIVTIKTSSEKSADILEEKFGKAMSSNPAKADFGNRWLGNLLLQIGMPKDDVIHRTSLRCRGQILYMLREDEKMISLATETAWEPMIECIRKFVDTYVDDADIFYVAEESNMGIFWTNDPDVVGNVWVDYEDVSAETEELLASIQDEKEKDAAKAFEEYLGHSGKLEDLAEELAENEDAFISVHTYEYVDATA